jgi:hypothetical protein
MGNTVTKRGTADKIWRIFDELDKAPCVKDAKQVSQEIHESIYLWRDDLYTFAWHWRFEIHQFSIGYNTDYDVAETPLDVINVAREVLRKGMSYLNIESEIAEIKHALLQLDRLETATIEAMKGATNEELLTSLAKVTALCENLESNQAELKQSLKDQGLALKKIDADLANKADRRSIPEYSLELSRIENKLNGLAESVQVMKVAVDILKPKPEEMHKKHSIFKY